MLYMRTRRVCLDAKTEVRLRTSKSCYIYINYSQWSKLL